MPTVLEELYHGEYCRRDKYYHSGERLRLALLNASDCCERCEALLGDEQKPLFAVFLNAKAEADKLALEERFLEGISLGMRMMVEINQKKDEK